MCNDRSKCVIGLDEEDVYQELLDRGWEDNEARETASKITSEELQQIAWELADYLWNGDLFHDGLATLLEERGHLKTKQEPR